MIYVLLVLILVGVGLNEITKRYILNNVNYKREIGKKVVEIGEEFEVITIVENKKILPVTFLQVTEKFPSAMSYKFKASVLPSVDHIFHKTTMFVMPYQRIKRIYKAFCNKRGRFIFRDVTLAGGDLFGIGTITKEVEYLQDIIVLPRPADLEQEITAYGDYYGDFSVKRWIIDDPVLTVGIREYTGSEPLKTIHWPSTLKSNSLMVKRFDYTSDNTVMIVLNIECLKPFWSGIRHVEIEKCISISRTIIDKLAESGIPYGFITDAYYSGSSENGRLEAPGFGTNHYLNIVENLGRIDYNICMEFEELLWNLIKDGVRYTTFVIVTPVIFQSYIEPINKLSENAMKTVLISLDKDNMEYLKNDILTFIERRD